MLILINSLEIDSVGIERVEGLKPSALLEKVQWE
jgi:hypothetical protein